MGGRLEGCSPGGVARVAMVRDARAWPALLTMRLRESSRPYKSNASLFGARPAAITERSGAGNGVPGSRKRLVIG